MAGTIVEIERVEIMPTNHPFVVRVEGICGGRPIIVGTRTPVRSIIGYHKMGMSVGDTRRPSTPEARSSVRRPLVLL